MGDRFYLCENKILCENDYEERLQYFATNNSNQSATNVNNSETKNKFNDCSPTNTANNTNVNNLKSLNDNGNKNAREYNGFGKEFAGFAIRRQSDVPIVVR